MATDLKGVIARLAQTAGIPETDKNLQALLSNEGIEKIEVSPLFEQALNEGLMTYDSAINNPKVNSHIRATVLNGIDATILKKAQEVGFEQSEIDELKSGETTGKRLISLVEKLERKLATKSAGKEDKAEWEKKVKELHDQLTATEEKYKSELQETKNSFLNKQKNISLDSVLSQYQYGVELPQDVIKETAKNLIARKLSEKKYRHEFDPEQNKHSLKGEDGLEVYNGNTALQFSDFVQSILAENKLLKVSGEPAKQPDKQIQTTQTTAPTFDTSAMEAQLAAFK